MVKKMQDKKKKDIEYTIAMDRQKGRGKRKCQVSGSTKGLIRKYSLNVTRKTFREIAKELGFKRYH